MMKYVSIMCLMFTACAPIVYNQKIKCENGYKNDRVRVVNYWDFDDGAIVVSEEQGNVVHITKTSCEVTTVHVPESR